MSIRFDMPDGKTLETHIRRLRTQHSTSGGRTGRRRLISPNTVSGRATLSLARFAIWRLPCSSSTATMNGTRIPKRPTEALAVAPFR